MFGVGNLLGTFLDGACEGFGLIQVVQFPLMYIVNFFFAIKNFDYGMLIVERLLFENHVNLFIILVFSAFAVSVLKERAKQH